MSDITSKLLDSDSEIQASINIEDAIAANYSSLSQDCKFISDTDPIVNTDDSAITVNDAEQKSLKKEQIAPETSMKVNKEFLKEKSIIFQRNKEGERVEDFSYQNSEQQHYNDTELGMVDNLIKNDKEPQNHLISLYEKKSKQPNVKFVEAVRDIQALLCSKFQNKKEDCVNAINQNDTLWTPITNNDASGQHNIENELEPSPVNCAVKHTNKNIDRIKETEGDSSLRKTETSDYVILEPALLEFLNRITIEVRNAANLATIIVNKWKNRCEDGVEDAITMSSYLSGLVDNLMDEIDQKAILFDKIASEEGKTNLKEIWRKISLESEKMKVAANNIRINVSKRKMIVFDGVDTQIFE